MCFWFFLRVLFGTRWVLGVSCRVWCVLFACSFRASMEPWAPAVRYCLFFLFSRFGPLGLQLSGIVYPFCLCSSGLEGSAGFGCRVHIVCSSFLFSSGLQGSWRSSCRVLPILFVWSVRASRDPGVPAVGYYLLFLSGLFGPRGILGLPVGYILFFFVFVLFWATKDPQAPAVGYCLFCSGLE